MKQGKPETKAALLEIIDLSERAKNSYQRDRTGNSQSDCIFYELDNCCELFYPGRYKGGLYREPVGFVFHYN